MGNKKRMTTLGILGVGGFLLFVAFQDPEVQRIAKIVAWVIGGLFAAFAALAIFGWWVKRRGGGAAGSDGKLVTRGTKITGAAALAREIWGRKGLKEATSEIGIIKLGPVPIPPECEPKHFLISGSTGTGKSQAITAMILGVFGRAGSALIVDSGGGYYSRLTDGDYLLLNPFDRRTVDWNPFAEIRADYDCDRIAQSVIPAGTDEWSHYAQSFLSSVMLTLWRGGNRNLGELLDWLTNAAPSDLRELLQGTPGAAVVAEGNERMLGSVRSIVSTYVAPWTHLRPDGDFSIRDWVQRVADPDDDQTGPLFIVYRDDQLAQLRRMVATWIDLAVVEGLSLPEDSNRQLWFVMDELDSLGRVASLDVAMSKLRKYGGRCVLGIQTISQLRETYGRERAQTICANAANKLILRSGDNETGEYFSRELGEQDVEESRTSQTVSPGLGGKSKSHTTATHRERRSAVLASELGNLPDLTGYLSLAGYNPALVNLDHFDIPEYCPPFEPRTERPNLSAVPDKKAAG